MVCNYTQLEGKEKESILTAPDGYQLNNFFKENYTKKISQLLCGGFDSAALCCGFEPFKGCSCGKKGKTAKNFSVILTSMKHRQIDESC